MRQFQVALQVRLGSQRLRRKAFLPLGELPERPKVLDWVLWNLRRSRRIERFLLLCPLCDAEELYPYAQRYGFELFAGSEPDVLERFSQALERYPAEYCFRATADNPLAPGTLLDFMIEDLEALQNSLQDSLQESFDYYWIDGLPYGCAFELFRSAALLSLKQPPIAALLEAEDCEHVTRYLYSHPQQFRLRIAEISALLGHKYAGLQELRLTLDTQEDWLRLQELLPRLCMEEEFAPFLLSLKDL